MVKKKRGWHCVGKPSPNKGKSSPNKGRANVKNRRGDHWDDVRTMCNEGKTQKEIQDALGLTWTEARNAILSLKREGVI